MAGEALNLAFGKVLRKLREARGLSQEELAHRARTGQPYISLLETGKHSPSLITMDLLARAFEMKPSALVQLVERDVDRSARGAMKRSPRR